MTINLKELLISMKRIRMVEESIADNYNNEVRQMHTPVHLYDGQEAVAVGICAHLEKDDMVFSNHRCHGHYLAKGGNLKKMIAELHNKETGCCKGHGGSMHLMDKENGVALTSAIVAGNVSIGTGYALSEKIKKENHISVIFFGDGASEEGSVYESICFAKLMNLPVVFVCENNLYSIDTPLDKREPKMDISSKFTTILPVKKVDGNNVAEVYATAQEAVESARQGRGPMLIECMTYRFRAHHNVGNGVDGKYRTENELMEWKSRCPIERLKNKLLSENMINEEWIIKVEMGIQKEIDEAFIYAQNSICPDASGLQIGLWG